MARSPRVFAKLFAGGFLDEGPLSLRRREPVIDCTTARLGCEYEWGVHITLFAQRAGLTEAEIAGLSPEERREFLEGIGAEEPGLARLIRRAYSLLDLITYFTAGKQEVRAWTIQRGTLAPGAAGKIHSDIERGFIRAEVMAFDEFMIHKSEAKMREAGKARLEGKEYVVRDGDIIHFRHAT